MLLNLYLILIFMRLCESPGILGMIVFYRSLSGIIGLFSGRACGRSRVRAHSLG